jgi:hypothetical protein
MSGVIVCYGQRVTQKCRLKTPQHEHGKGHVEGTHEATIIFFASLFCHVGRQSEDPMSRLVRVPAQRRPHHAKIRTELYLKKDKVVVS